MSLKSVSQNQQAEDEDPNQVMSNLISPMVSAKAGLSPASVRTTRLMPTDNNHYRVGPRLIKDHMELKAREDKKPARISPYCSENDGDKSMTLLIYMWTLTEKLEVPEIDLNFIKALLADEVNINNVDEYGQTFVHALVRDWNPDLIRFAHDYNADLNTRDHYGVTPLHLVAALNLKESAEQLLKYGASHRLKTKGFEQTVMHYAARYNSLDVLRLLVQHGGDINDLDVDMRSPLFLAAENGCLETAAYLVDIGAPVGLSNKNGVHTMSLLIQKIPRVAIAALRQYIEEDPSKHEKRLNLYRFESYDMRKGQFLKTPMEIIVSMNRTDLANHPMVQRAVSEKYRLIDMKNSALQLILTVINASLWLFLAYYFSDNSDYYYPLEKHGWKIALEALIVMLWLYFFVGEMLMNRRIQHDHNAWVLYRNRSVLDNLPYCHPRWPAERESILQEAKHVSDIPCLSKVGWYWFLYEFLQLISMLGVAVTRIIDWKIGTISTLLLHKMIFCIGMFISWIRILKTLCRFQTFSALISLTGTLFESLTQFFLLFLQLYIPIVAAFWALFGENEDNVVEVGKVVRLNETDAIFGHSRPNQFFYMDLSQIAYNVYEMVLIQGIMIPKYKKIAPGVTHIVHLILDFFLVFIGFNTFNALAVSNYQHAYKRCIKDAMLTQSANSIRAEKLMNPAAKEQARAYYKRNLNPLVVCDSKYDADREEHDLYIESEKARRQMNTVHSTIKDIINQQAEVAATDNEAALQVVKEKLEELCEKQVSFSKCLQKDLKELHKKQEIFIKRLPKLLDKIAEK